LALLLSVAGVSPPLHADGLRPNIILAMADDMGWGDPGYNSVTVTLADGATPHPDRGWINTPTLDAMAAAGLQFNRFYAASAVCSPTRASCLTGRNPFRVGVPTANSGKLGFNETPLSEVLSGAGYRCGHFGKWHLGTLTTLRKDSNRGANGNTGDYSAPWHHDYDACFATEAKVPTYHPYRKSNNSAPLPLDFTDPNFYGTHYWRIPGNPLTDPEGDVVPVGEVNDASDGDDSKLLVDRAIPFIRTAVSNASPFFVVLWFHTPHKPLVDPDGVSGVDSSDACKDAIEDLDTALGRLRGELDTLGVRSNTMLWVTSDNGPENGVNSPNESDTVRSMRSGGYRARKRSLHEGGVRVPGILEWPAVVTAARTTDYPCVTSDYYPTILDALDLVVTNQKPIDGISLMPVITNTTDALTRTNAIGFRFSNSRSWVTQQHKLISKDQGATYELYDLLGDRTETNDLAAAKPDLAARMQLELETWLAAVAADTEYVPPGDPGTTTGTVVHLATSETVDSQGDIPGDDDNNLDKFDVGGAYGAEFTTRLYVRSSSSAADRKVRAYAKFDLSGLSSTAVARATLEFRGFSLNDSGGNDMDLYVSRLTEDWASAADPYAPGVADTVNGGSVITPGAPTTGADFAVDVTPIVNAWVGGAAKYGFFLQPSVMNKNNGLGIKTNGTGAIRLVVQQAVADADGDGMDDAWEIEHFGSTTNSSGTAGDDGDGDGFIDLFEFRAGTNPTNPASLLALTGVVPSSTTNGVVVTWQSVPGKLYDVMSATDLLNPTWVTNAGGIAGLGPQCVHTMVVDRPAGFVEVRVE